jgi:HSP20 family protein
MRGIGTIVAIDNVIVKRRCGMSLFRWDPINVSNLRTEIDSIFSRILGTEPRKGQGVYVITPYADVYETGMGFVLALEMPGVKKEDIEVKTEAGLIRICADKSAGETPEEEKRRSHIAERSWGKYERSFELPDYLDLEKASAEYEDGVLVLQIPRREESMQREIKVQVK